MVMSALFVILGFAMLMGGAEYAVRGAVAIDRKSVV